MCCQDEQPVNYVKGNIAPAIKENFRINPILLVANRNGEGVISEALYIQELRPSEIAW